MSNEGAAGGAPARGVAASINLEKLRILRREAGHVRARAPGTEPASTRQPLQAIPSARATEPGTLSRNPTPPFAEPAQATPPFALLAKAALTRPDSQSIDALRKILGRRGQVRTPMRPRQSPDRHLPGEEISPGLRLIESRVALSAPRDLLSLAFAKRHDEAVAARDLLFFDTETTGLAGGTGTRAFMIGAADWQGDELRVRQLLMTTMSAESAMLDAFGGWLREKDTVLSSYNGRCYDAPLLKTRYRLARKQDPITPLDHVDLLFPTRRRYRGIWENCRLATIERELLRIVRQDDLPGSEAPAAWLDYLRGGAARNLRRVAAHNHQDVVTLALLMVRLVAVHAEEVEVTS